MIACEGGGSDPAGLGVVDRREDERIARQPEVPGNLRQHRPERLVDGHQLRKLLRVEARPLQEGGVVNRIGATVVR